MIRKPRAHVARSWERTVSDVGRLQCQFRYPPDISAASSPHTIHDSRPKSRDAIPIHHLLNAPEGDDLAPRFPIRDSPSAGPDEDDATLNDAEDSSETSEWSKDYDQNDVFVGAPMPEFDAVNFDAFFGGFETLTFGSYPLHHDMSQMTSGPGVASPSALLLEPRAYEIRQLLFNTASKYAAEYPGDPHLPILASNIELMTNVEIDHCLNSYFNNYHRHCPIIHRPSFQPTMVPAALLLACVALGAMYAEPVRVAWMKTLLDVIEQYVFSLPALKDDYHATSGYLQVPDDEGRHYHWQTFQGAYLFVVVQFFSGNLAARRRARRGRFCTVLNVS